jgi:hypothetical protein
MTPHFINFLRSAVWQLSITGPVLEIGSYIEANQDHLNLRQAFLKETPYVGVDLLRGEGVDVIGDLTNWDQIDAIAHDVNPKVILCPYVLEHSWDIGLAAKNLGRLWNKYDSWLWIVTHQSQPYHGTDKYGDFWRVTTQGLRRLMDVSNISGATIWTTGGPNPEDVLAIRQPGGMVWPGEDFIGISSRSQTTWEQV